MKTLDEFDPCPASDLHSPGVRAASQAEACIALYLRDIADAFAAKGYLAAAPDLFWRSVPGPLKRDDPRSRPRGQPRLEKIKAGEQDLADTLAKIGQKFEAFEAEHSNMQALAQIGGVVNSSLELDEVLRIVMDNIVRLTKAERGFLMLRNDKGEMVTFTATVQNKGRAPLDARYVWTMDGKPFEMGALPKLKPRQS